MIDPQVDPARFQDYAYWRRFLRVVNLDPSVPIVPFEPKPFQRMIGERIVAADRDGRPFRAIVLKSRRMGSSTAIQTRMLHRACTRAHFNGLTVAQDRDPAAYLFNMSVGMWERLPAGVKIPKESGQAGRHLQLANRSTLATDTAMDVGAGRSTGQQFVHASEFAHWPKEPKKTIASLRSVVPEKPGTAFVLESTANGVGNPFHDEWVRAESGNSAYEPIFAPWFMEPDYVIRGGGKGVKILDEREDRLLEMGVSRDQLAWRRATIEGDSGGDERMFDQEYPDSPLVAFLTTGRPFFGDVNRLKGVEPAWRGDLVGDPVRGGRISSRRDALGSTVVWEKPREGERYAVFVDVAGIANSAEYEARQGDVKEDFSSAHVISLDRGVFVAAMHGRWDSDVLALDVARLGRLYNTATVAVENTGGYGTAVLMVLDKVLLYPRLYRQRDASTHQRREGQRLGWSTNVLTRPLMLDALKAVVRDHPERVVDRGLVAEMRTFIVRRNGKPMAAQGCYDDRVMSAAGALAVFAELASTAIRLAPRRSPQRVRSFQSRAPRAELRSKVS